METRSKSRKRKRNDFISCLISFHTSLCEYMATDEFLLRCTLARLKLSKKRDDSAYVIQTWWKWHLKNKPTNSYLGSISNQKES